MKLLKLALLLLAFAFAVRPAAAQEGGWMGIRIVDLSQEEAASLGWPAPRGARITGIVPGGPADAAGLRIGDIVLTVDGQPVPGYRDLIRSLAARSSGAQVGLAVLREGRDISITVKMASRSEALAEFDREISRDPDSITLRLTRAEIYFSLDEPAKAAPDCDQILRLDPGNGSGLFCRARVLIGAQRFDEALNDLNAAALKQPRDERILVARATLAARKGDHDAAIADLNRALALDERNPVALALRGEAYLAKGLTERAIDDFKRALAIDQGNARARDGLAAAQARQQRAGIGVPGNPPTAVPSVPIAPAPTAKPDAAPTAKPAPAPTAKPDPAPKASPAPAPTAQPGPAPTVHPGPAPTPERTQVATEVDSKLAVEVNHRVSDHEIDQAIKLIDDALVKTPSHAGLYNLRGLVRKESGDLGRAMEDFARALALAPQFEAAHANRIATAVALHKFDDARTACDAFVRALPDLPRPYKTCAAVAVEQGKLADAKALLDTAIEKDALSVSTIIDRGRVNLLMKSYEAAIADFDRAAKLGGTADAYAWRGRAYLAKGDEPAAIRDFQAALARNKANLPAIAGLQALQVVKALAQLGQIKKP